MHIKLNGLLYDAKKTEQALATCEEWEKDIFYFLAAWFNDSDTVVLHTSGSTGIPKEILLSKTAMRNSAQITNYFFGMDEYKVALLCLPASYIAGKMMLVRAIEGKFNLITSKPTANPFAELHSPIDFAAITPYQLQNSIENMKKASIRNCIVGGGSVGLQLETIAQKIPTALYETYGMTETASHIALRRINGENKSEDFTVLDGVSIHQDLRGCLVITAPHLSNTEFVTNDIVKLTGDNSFRWIGRADTIINSGGIKISPEAIEKKLETLIDSPFFITSVPDEALDNRVVLVIESNPYSAEKEAEFTRKLRHYLQKHEIPRQLFYIPKFVYSVSNKILRKETLERFTSNKR
ncbi:MAG: AMP-binding protein [Bacteroidia bacterium]|nr:AMP-binding protein [Bacteroidia bacterium]